MKKNNIFLWSFLIVSIHASPINNEVKLLRYTNTNSASGKYEFSFATSDGTEREEQGTVLQSENPENDILRVTGSFSYVGPDGVTYKVNYIADEFGYQPEGDHLPNPHSSLPMGSVASMAFGSVLGSISNVDGFRNVKFEGNTSPMINFQFKKKQG